MALAVHLPAPADRTHIFELFVCYVAAAMYYNLVCIRMAPANNIMTGYSNDVMPAAKSLRLHFCEDCDFFAVSAIIEFVMFVFRMCVLVCVCAVQRYENC